MNRRSFGFLLAGGLCVWYLAGSITTWRSVGYPDPPPFRTFLGVYPSHDGLTPSEKPIWDARMAVPMKAGLYWALIGIPFVLWKPIAVRRSLRQFEMMLRSHGALSRRNPRDVAMLTTATCALPVGIAVGSALGYLLIPNLVVPTGAVIGPWLACVCLGALLTAVANSVCVPWAARVVFGSWQR